LILFVTDSTPSAAWITPAHVSRSQVRRLQGTWTGQRRRQDSDAPSGIVLDKYEQSLYIADTSNAVVRRLDLATLMVFTVIGAFF
jgi:sugar lactone lactonase YvrE